MPDFDRIDTDCENAKALMLEAVRRIELVATKLRSECAIEALDAISVFAQRRHADLVGSYGDSECECLLVSFLPTRQGT